MSPFFSRPPTLQEVPAFKHQNGLQQLHAPKEAAEPEFDIVAIHGLNGDSIKTWTHPTTNFMWLSDHLPVQFPNARIFTYGYDFKMWFTRGSGRIEGQAHRLLEELECEVVKNRLVVFICHSLGGILLKMAMVKAKSGSKNYGFILEQPKVVMFMATPNFGSKAANVLDLLCRFSFLFGGIMTHLGIVNDEAIDLLKSHSKDLENLAEDFIERIEKFEYIISLYETKPHSLLGSVVVDQRSATLNSQNERRIPVNTDHAFICKFKSDKDSEMVSIIKFMKKMINKTKAKISISELASLTSATPQAMAMLPRTPLQPREAPSAAKNSEQLLTILPPQPSQQFPSVSSANIARARSPRSHDPGDLAAANATVTAPPPADK